MRSEFHPQILEDAAAWLFWTLVAKNGFAPTLDEVLNTKGRSLLDCSDKEVIFSRYPLKDMPQDDFTQLCDAVAEYGWRKASQEENLIGMIYIEDRESGRAPSAVDIDTKGLDLPLKVKGDTLPTYGSLCIRHPLPAVVFTDTPPPAKGHFRVKDTRALGFSMPLWIAPHAADKVAEGLWLVTGIFYIPENLELSGHPWANVIPNSICSQKGMVLQGKKSPVKLDFLWSESDEDVTTVPKSLVNKIRNSALYRTLFGLARS